MTTDLISRARAGDGEAFRELTEPHRRELQVHCYRMLGSFARRRGRPAGHAAGRLAGPGRVRGARLAPHLAVPDRHQPVPERAPRRPAGARPGSGTSPGSNRPEPTRLGEVVWLEPFPDALLEGAIGAPLGPEVRYEQAESISLAFVTALQVLPPRQLAVLILRDVLGFRASEVADMLEVDRRVGHQRAEAGARQPAALAAGRGRPRALAGARLTGRGRDRGEVRPRVRVRRPRRAGGPADR